ncbi:MAG: phasin family protein [Cyanobacteria bacterium P01_C01_bin.89]
MDNQNWLQQLLTIGVGTTAVVTEKLKEVSDEWVKTGKLDPDQARQLVDEVMQSVQGSRTGDGRSPAETMEDMIRKQVRQILADFGVPEQKELDELRGRLDRVERQVRDLENRLWR